jgi:hypothetical protein
MPGTFFDTSALVKHYHLDPGEKDSETSERKNTELGDMPRRRS